MSEAWPRRIPHLELNVAEAAMLLERAGLSTAIKNLALIPEGLGNSNYRVSLPDGDLVIRLYGRRPAAVDKEQGLTNYLRSHGMRVPEYLFGETLPLPYAVIEWVEGRSSREILRDPAQRPRAALELAEFITNLRRLEISSEDPQGLGLDSVIPPAEAFRESVLSALTAGQAGQHLETKTVARLCSEFSKHATEAHHGARGLVHGDFSGDNILWTFSGGQPRIKSVIDWEFAGTGPLGLDAGRMLRFTSVLPPDDFETPFTQALNKNLGWSKTHRNQADVLELWSLLGLIDHDDPHENIVTDVRRLLDEMLERWGASPH